MSDTAPVFRAFRVPSAADPGDPVAPTYLILHGVGLSHRFYTGLARRLSRSGEVVSFDLPGFGRSPSPSHNLTVEHFAAGVGQQLRARNIGPVIAIGHSMGAQIAVELALQFPELVTGVVLVGPVVDPARPTLRQQSLALARDAALEPPLTQLATLFDYVRCGVPWFLSASQSMRDYPIHLAVPQLSQPLLVIRGEDDPIATVAWSRRLSEEQPGGMLVTIPGRRHNVPHSDPTTTAAVITDFALLPG